jgi:PAS domain S-box-containing protein
VGIKQLLAAPEYPDDAERSALARIFNIVSLVVILALGAAMFTNLFFSQTTFPVVLPVVFACVGALIAGARLGHLRVASSLLPTVILAGSAYVVLTRDGVHDTGVLIIAATLVIGGILLTRRALMILTITALAVILSAGYAEIAGLLHNRLSSFTDTRYVVGVSLVFVVIAVTVHLLTESLLTSLRQAQEKSAALGESEARLAKMIEASPEAITIASVEDGTFILVNPAGQRLCGYTHEELIGNSAVRLGFYVDPEERRSIVADLRRNEVVYGREIRLRRKNGEVRDTLTSAALIDFKDRKLILFQAIDITERKNAERALREHEKLLRELSAHHDSVREGERAHVAREIHDELGQALTALRMDLSVLTLKFGETTPQIREQVQELKGRVDAIIQVVRHVATSLRPAALDLGIIPGVEWLVEEFRKRSGIRCTVSIADSDVALGEDRSIVLFRIVQESLTNVSRHASARNVQILLDHDAERIRLDVEDDGVGFDVEAARRKKTFGLLGIQERVIMLRGELSIASAPGRGTRVSVSMPIETGQGHGS